MLHRQGSLTVLLCCDAGPVFRPVAPVREVVKLCFRVLTLYTLEYKEPALVLHIAFPSCQELGSILPRDVDTGGGW